MQERRAISKKPTSNGVNPDIFKAYDIRGIYPEEINEEAVYRIGWAFVKFLNKPGLKIVVGRDNRLSSDSLFKALVRGITEAGGDVVDIGLSPTPMFYFAVAHYGFDAGVCISASHNPPEYNGLKFVREKSIPVGGNSGLKEIKKIAAGRDFRFKKEKRGAITPKDVSLDYIKFNLEKFDISKIRPFRIIVDTANAVAGILTPKIFKKTNCKVHYLYSELDGSFPNHLPDPHIEKNLKGLKKEVLKKRADLGIAFDGDGDRVVFVDEKGKRIPGDLITALLAKSVLKENPGEKILCDVRSSNIVRKTVESEGGKAVLGRVGHVFIKERMRKENIIFQGELNGHYYLRKHYYSEAPFFAIFKILEEMSKRAKKISELVRPFKKYFYSGEINFKVKNKKRALSSLEKKFGGGKILRIDGLRVDFKDWWFLARPSHTEALLRLVIEAKTKKLMEEKKKELSKIIQTESR